jgi:hypothetical protein
MLYEYVKDPVYLSQDGSAVLCVVKFVDFKEEVPFNATNYDVEEHGRKIHQELISGVYGPIAPFVRNLESEWRMVRVKRDGLIKASDWTQFPDTQARFTDAQKTAWATYRQALRDIPQTFADPADVVWPTPPA